MQKTAILKKAMSSFTPTTPPAERPTKCMSASRPIPSHIAPPAILLTLTDGKNHTTTWNYDLYGRVTNKVDALGTNDFFHSQWSGATEMRGDVGGTRPVMVALVLVKNWRFRLRFW